MCASIGESHWQREQSVSSELAILCAIVVSQINRVMHMLSMFRVTVSSGSYMLICIFENLTCIFEPLWSHVQARSQGRGGGGVV